MTTTQKLTHVLKLIQLKRYQEAHDLLQQIPGEESAQLVQFLDPLLELSQSTINQEEKQALKISLIGQWVKREQQIYFIIAMILYLSSTLISLINPPLPNRTSFPVEIALNSTVNIWIVFIGFAFHWYSRQAKRIEQRLNHLAITATLSRFQSILTILGSLILLLSSSGSPLFVTIALLALCFGILQWRWLNQARQLAQIQVGS